MLVDKCHLLAFCSLALDNFPLVCIPRFGIFMKHTKGLSLLDLDVANNAIEFIILF